MKPVCYMRYLNGEPDWGEDCITVGNSAIDDHEDDADHVWESVPLYRAPPAQPAAEPVAPEDYSAFANLAMSVKRLVHQYRSLDPHDPLSDNVMKFLRECGGMGSPLRAAAPTKPEQSEDQP